jgi:hypothetical protein
MCARARCVLEDQESGEHSDSARRQEVREHQQESGKANTTIAPAVFYLTLVERNQFDAGRVRDCRSALALSRPANRDNERLLDGATVELNGDDEYVLHYDEDDERN